MGLAQGRQAGGQQAGRAVMSASDSSWEIFIPLPIIIFTRVYDISINNLIKSLTSVSYRHIYVTALPIYLTNHKSTNNSLSQQTITGKISWTPEPLGPEFYDAGTATYMFI